MIQQILENTTNIGKYDKFGNNNPMWGKKHSLKSRTLLSVSKKGKKMNLTEEQRQMRREQITRNTVMIGPKSPKQKARGRWSTLKKSFSKDPVVSDDIKMMHDYYSIHEKMEGLSKEHLLEFLKFRFKFLQEELNEGLEAIEQKNAEEVCDSLIDLMVVAVGTLDLYKIDFKKAWYEVLKANMNKEVGVKPSRPNPWGLPDLIKKQDWVPPSHENNHGLLVKTFEE